ncbi:MAG: hypothetical protein IJI22_05370 [Bacilli bacterium]|nr:hypothetical protein [Bacilli bacterium]
MINFEYIKNLLIISMFFSTINCTFIQKTKILFKSSKYLVIYSLIVNIVFSVIFCLTFTKISFISSFWIGLFSFLGADSIYKTFEGKILSYSELRKKSNQS